MFFERRLVKFQMSDGDDWGDEPPVPEEIGAYAVFDGTIAVQYYTADEALAAAELIRNEDIEVLHADSHKSIVVIQANTKDAIVQVLEGGATDSIATFLSHQYADYVLGSIKPSMRREFLHPEHIEWRTNSMAWRIASMLTGMSSRRELIKDPEYLDSLGVISFEYCRNGVLSTYYVTYDPNLNFSYILMHKSRLIIGKFDAMDDLIELLKNTA